MIQVWDLPGGIHPAENKSQSLKLPLVDCPLADEYLLPLNQHIGAPSVAVVAVGDEVKKYQLIADAEGIFSAALHAPTSGVITAIEDRFIAHPSGLKAKCIVLKADGKDTACELTPCEDPFALDHATLITKIRKAGIVGMGGAGFPSAVKLNPKSITKIDTLILNGTECEPYITADDILMQTSASEVIAGARLLAHVLGNPSRILIGVEDNKPEAIKALIEAAAGTQVQIVSFPTKYPSGGEKQLIYILTGKEVASGQLPAALGIVVQNVGTTVAAWRAVTLGEPLIERITTVVGQALATSRNMRIRVGTPVQHVLDHNGYNARRNAALIVGGPMMGFAIEQTCIPVIKTTNCLLVPSHAEMPPAPAAQACIRCGHCAEVCPAGLLPQQLYWYARSDDHSKLKSHNLFDCIECGACAYVCPSTIPLVQYYRAAKGDIRQTALDKKKSDQARERFEARQARLAEEEAAKEAKRQERKAVAERNKARLEEANAGNTTPSNAMVASAVDAAKQPLDTTQDKARLERTLESLNSRISRLQSQITTAEDDARRERFAAQIKQTQQSLNETQAKIDALITHHNPMIDVQISKVAEKLKANPLELAQKNLDTLLKRLGVAEEKLAEANAEGKSTANALAQGVDKLKQKIIEAEQALTEAKLQPATDTQDADDGDAAKAAIERAKQKAIDAKSMSPEQKQAAAIASLEQRISKARERLAQAEQDNDENLAAFVTGLQKLEQKLLDTKAEGTTEQQQG